MSSESEVNRPAAAEPAGGGGLGGEKMDLLPGIKFFLF